MVTQHRFCAFGAIADGTMRENVIGEMVERWWREIGNAHADVTPIDFVVMPNHFHGIIVIGDPPVVGADLRVRPIDSNVRPNDTVVRPRDSVTDPNVSGVQPNEPGPDWTGGCVDARVAASGANVDAGAPTTANDVGAHAGAPQPSLPRIIQWFKTITTNEYIRGVKQYAWPEFPGHFWERNYYEHIIRDDAEMKRIRDYVANNPAQWDRDRFHVDGH